MKFDVTVEKRMYATGKVTVDCDTADQAVELVENQIASGVLQTTAVDWSDAQYEDWSFVTTGVRRPNETAHRQDRSASGGPVR